MALAAPLAHALDNPDAPDYVAQFEKRAQPFEKHIDDQTSIYGTAQAGVAYANFLDKELNQAYQALLKKLTDPKVQEQLRKSQRAWLAYYKAETDFIWNNWVPDNFGSSYELSRQDYRNSLVKERIKVLLLYLRNY
jgi:uncharacterized protein YecT (DUF1311 family)